MNSGKDVRTMRRLRVWMYVVMAFAAASAFAASGDDFYDRLYTRGIAQFGEGNYGGAYGSLRLAAFGSLDDLKRFETAEVYMTLAALRMHNDADARIAAQRVVAGESVERRYASLSLPDAIRREFEGAAKTLLTPDQYAVLHGAAPQPPPMVVPAQQMLPTQTQPQPQPQPRPAPAQPQPQPKTQPPPQPQSSAADAPSLADADRAINAGDLARARAMYGAILDQPRLMHANALRVGEGLYRARDFAGSLRAFERAGPIGAGEEQYHWYYAVALYEAGHFREAQRELRAALPYVELTRDMERIAALIEHAAE
jgi:tetratricopeptide (TPR) repeat protein